MERGWYQNVLITVTGDHSHPRGRDVWAAVQPDEDCDQRDKRLGWMGDAGLSSDSMFLNFHMDLFLPHYAQLMNDDQVKGPTVVQCCTGNAFSLIKNLRGGRE